MPIQIGAASDAGFDEPLRLLSDCHRRIERFLEMLERVACLRQGGALDNESREAMTAALRYFREAAPRHTADEEESLFPRMRELPAGRAPAIAETLSRLESDHDAVRAGHEAVDRLGDRWLNENCLTPPEIQELRTHLDRLKEAYTAHIAIEDTQVFPAAGRMLSAEQLAEIGQEMAHRRAVRHVVEPEA